jgi:uncharacterized membrane protein
MRLRALWSEHAFVGGRWTLKDLVQGKPFGVASHPIFVHFPAALLPAAFLFDVISRIHADLTITRAAFYDIVLGLVISTAAIVTGLTDYLPMIGGSRKKTLGTYHLIGQIVALSCFGLSLLLRAFDYDAEQTGWPALALAAMGTLAIGVANHFGGQLVYRQGMRVNVDP